jgi:hypothetical protein
MIQVRHDVAHMTINTSPYPVLYNDETTSRGRLAGRGIWNGSVSVENNINPAYTMSDGQYMHCLRDPIMYQVSNRMHDYDFVQCVNQMSMK